MAVNAFYWEQFDWNGTRERFVTDQATHTLAGPPELRWGNSLLPRLGEGRASGTVIYHRLATQGGEARDQDLNQDPVQRG